MTTSLLELLIAAKKSNPLHTALTFSWALPKRMLPIYTTAHMQLKTNVVLVLSCYVLGCIVVQCSGLYCRVYLATPQYYDDQGITSQDYSTREAIKKTIRFRIIVQKGINFGLKASELKFMAKHPP